jgi:hypothetical protein
MPYQLFHNLFPEVAEEETRTVIVFEESGSGLPAGHYSFLEMFCNEEGCDCRRVFFYVVSSRRQDVEAVIAYGWESRQFYARWMGDDDPLMLAELKGPVLNMGSPQSNLAGRILELFSDVLLNDTAYMERVKRHYRMFRDEIDGKPTRKGKPTREGKPTGKGKPTRKSRPAKKRGKRKRKG